MPPGPLPGDDARRRNPPTIPTTNLPASGRKGRPPKVPDAYPLGAAGKAWWRWAWGLPQAVAWDAGALYTLARRAQLEDEQATCELVDGLDLADLLAGADDEAIKRVEWALSTLKRAATASVTLMKEMRELDKVLGLNPAAMAALRWKIVADEEAAGAAKTATARPRRGKGATVHRLRAVDPKAATA